MSSLKIERDTFQRGPAAPSVTPSAATATRGGPLVPGAGPLPGTSGKHPLAEAVGTVITGGQQNAGTKGYLRVCRRRRRPPDSLIFGDGTCG